MSGRPARMGGSGTLGRSLINDFVECNQNSLMLLSM